VDVAQGSVAQGGGEPRGHGPTREGATGTGLDGPVAGAAILLSLYGLLVVAVDLIADKSLVPDDSLLVAGIILGCLVVGAVLGAIGSSVSDR
jgi:cell division protein FtsX